MTTFARGTVAVIDAQFREYAPNGPLVNVDNISVTVVPLLGGAAVLPPTTVGIINSATGIYAYAWSIATSVPAGQYVIIWSGDDMGTGNPVQASQQITITYSLANSGSDGPCNWTIDTSCVPGWDELPDHAQSMGYDMATYQLWALTGRRFGLCEIVVQPCRQRAPLPLYMAFPVPGVGFYGGYGGSGGFGPVIEDGQWYNRCWGGCRCRARCEVVLEGPTDTASVLQVTVKGDMVDPSAYQIQNGYLLVRTDGHCFPTCVDYSKQDPPEFTVTYLRGERLPNSLQLMAGKLAYEYGLACVDDDRCRLPTRLQSMSRQGVSVQVSLGTQYVDFGMTQIPEIDQLVITMNPNRLTERPRVFSIDNPRPRQVT